MVLILISALAVPLPHFFAKFVPIADLNDDVEIQDARKDLSALGYSIGRGAGGDWVVENAIYVIKGRVRNIKQETVKNHTQNDVPAWTPSAFGPHGLLIVDSPFPNAKQRFASIHNGSLVIGKTIEGKPSYGTKEAVAKNQTFQRVPAAWLQDADIHVDGAGSVTYDWYPFRGYSIGVGTDSPLANIEFYWAVARAGAETRRIQELVTNMKKPWIEQICFVSKEGWLVASGGYGSSLGLFWLFPVKRR